MRIERLLAATTLIGALAFYGCDGGGDDDDTDGATLPDVGGKCVSGALNWEMWVPRQEANDLKIMNGPRFSLEETVDLSTTGLVMPHNITFSPDEKYAFIAMLGNDMMMNSNGGVVILDVESRDVLKVVTIGAKTHKVGITPDNRRAWAVNVNNDTISVIDLTAIATATVTNTITVGGTGGPLVAEFAPDGSKAYITNKNVSMATMKSSVSVFNTSTFMRDGTDYSTGMTTTEEALTKDGKTLYITNGGDNNVEKIDLSAADRSTAVTKFAEGVMGSHAVVLSEKYVIVTARGGGRIQFYDGNAALVKDLTVEATMGNAQPDIVALSPDCKRAYAAEKTGGSLFEITVATQESRNKMDFGGGVPHGVAVVSRPSDM
jgi:YVTN family beta-propeller protein